MRMFKNYEIFDGYCYFVQVTYILNYTNLTPIG